MNLLEPLVRRPSALVTPASFGYNGHQYPIFGGQGARPDVPDQTFLGYIAGIHERNGVVAAAVEARALLLSGVRFEWERDNGERFRNLASRRLTRPGSMTGPAFRKTLEYDVSYHGAAYVVNDGPRKRRLRPDRVSVVLGSNIDPEWSGDGSLKLPYDAETVALMYHPNPDDRATGQLFFRGQFAQWAPEPDPINFWRGTSWVTSVMREIVTDGQATETQQNYFDQGTVPGLVYIMDPSQSPEQVKAFAETINNLKAGAGNAHRNHYLGGGTDVKVVGSTLEKMGLKDLQGGLENRIAIRSRVPAVVLGAREGLSGSSLNAGNYSAARRLLADGWFSPTADSLCASLEDLVAAPADAELTYDAARVLFLQEDQKDAADIINTKIAAARQGVDGGFEAESVTEAIHTGDIRKLRHTGKLSVQLQEPGTGDDLEELTE